MSEHATESKNWNPSKWSEDAIRLRVQRVYRAAEKDLAYLVGPHVGNTIIAELIAKMKEHQSRAEIHRRGERVIGDRHA